MPIVDMRDALSDLTESITIERSSPGTYVKGQWVKGLTSDIPASATVLPASGEDITDIRIEGDTDSSFKKFYSETVFKVANATDKAEADIIIYNSDRYKVLTVSDYLAMAGYNKAVTVKLTT